MCLREIYQEFVVAKFRSEAEDDRDITLAWRFAALTRGTKGLPKLETLLHRRKRSSQQTVHEQIAMWQIIAARFGGQFRPHVVQTEGTSGR